MKKSKSWSISKSVSVSLICHFLLFLVVFVTPPKFFETPKPEIVQVEFIQPQRKTPELPTLKARPPPKIEKQQVVDQDERALNEESPDDNRFLSAHNQVVKKQTIAPNRGDFKNTKSIAQKPGTGGKPEFKPLTVDDLKPKFDISKTIQDRLDDEKEREKKSEEDALKVLDEKKNAKQEKPPEKPAGDGTEGNSGAQASQSIDYIKDLDPGLETLLSTKEFVYYTYYARIRRQLNQHWGPKVREKLTKLYRSGRMIASSDDKITKLLITLDSKGNLVRAQVIGDSGVRDLDEAAVESFRAAAPFPNPPEGMIDPDGQIKIRWDFILEA